MKIGDIVKSYDFVGIEDCYMIGKIVGIREYDGEFRAKFIKRVWCGAEDRKFKTDYFTASMQGNHFRDRSDIPRVVVVG